MQIMKHKTSYSILATALTAVLAFGLSSCVSDDSTGDIYTLPELAIKGSESTGMPEYNFYLGNEAVITPEITYTGDEADLTYKWEIGTYANSVKGELEEVSTDKVLHYDFKDGGSYYAHLTVTDGKVGQVIDYKINMQRTFEEGYVLTSTDADGKGNLSFIKVLTPEEKAAGTKEIVMEHCLEAMNEDYSEDGLIKAVIGKVTWPKDLTRVLVSTKDHCYFLDPNNFTVITSINYTDLYSDFKATEFMTDSYVPYAFDANTKKFAHLNLTYMFPYEYTYFKGLDAEDFIYCEYYYWGSVYSSTLFLNYSKNAAYNFQAYAPYYGIDTYFPQCGTIPDGQKLLTGYCTSSNSYLFTKEASTGNIYFWTYAFGWGSEDTFTSKTIEATADMAVPEQGTRFTLSNKFARYYYALGNCVYVFVPGAATLTLPSKSEYAIQFGSNEEVTYTNVNLNTEELYVATYDKTTQRGNFYIYDCADVRTDNSSNVQPKESHKSCAGRISYVMYKPSIQ